MLHGIKVNEITTGTRPILGAITSVIGLLATAGAEAGPVEDALDAAFPLDTPVLVTDIRKAIGLAGTTGTLKPALQAIADQTSPYVVVIRVAEAEGAEPDPTQDELVIGDVTAGVYTGAQLLLVAESMGLPRPRIIGAPGLDTQAVVTALVPIAQKLRSMVYAAGIGDDVAEAVTYAGNFSQRELMLIWPGTDSAFLGDATARALGLRARLDQEIGWHKTLSNIGINGILGIEKPVSFDILGGDTDAKLLNDAMITTLVNRDGYRFWGNRTLSDEPLYSFESATRTAQVLQDEIAEGLTWAIDKPLTAVLVKDIIETCQARGRRLVATGRLIGVNFWFDPALNAPEDLAAGQLVIDYDFTPAAPLEGLELNQRITGRYYASFAELAA